MSIYFNKRDGKTVLSSAEEDGLKLSYITTIRELDEVEQRNIAKGLLWLNSSQWGNFLSESFVLKLHKKMFGDVWKWAGAFRKSNKNIGVDYWKITIELKVLCGDVEYWIKHQTYSPIEMAARFHHRLVAIHPFPNGNGRFGRIFTDYLLIRNDLPKLNWGAHMIPDQRRAHYILSLRAADQDDYSKLVDFLSM